MVNNPNETKIYIHIENHVVSITYEKGSKLYSKNFSTLWAKLPLLIIILILLWIGLTP